MVSSGTSLTETLAITISNNQQYKADYIDYLDASLLAAGEYVIKNRGLISNTYLAGLTETFVVSELYWYNPDGLLLYDAM